jgi:hypothetical protein
MVSPNTAWFARVVAALLVWMAVGQFVAAEPPTFINGYSWGWVGRRGDYASAEAAESMKKLAETGANTVCIAFATEMQDAQTPEFGWADQNPRMVSDDEIRRAIDLVRANDMEVILKPVINCRDRTWRAWIKFYRPATAEERAAGVTGTPDPWQDEPATLDGMVVDEQKWNAWWERYAAFILHYACLAEEKQVKMLCLGCEMSSTEAQEDRWRTLIAQVRKVYHGAITYNVNHGREGELKWWDAVDVISISAYYPDPPPEGMTLEEAARQTTPVTEIVAELEKVKTNLAALSTKWRRPILFIETGVANIRGCARYPWSQPRDPREHPTDEQEQANYYQAMFEVFHEEPWFLGYAWWDWPARLYDAEGASNNRSFCIYGKHAEQVLRHRYAKPREATITP